jgi:hypothetical protein
MPIKENNVGRVVELRLEGFREDFVWQSCRPFGLLELM